MRHWFIPDMFWANHTNYPISWICHEALVHTRHVLGQPHKLSYFMNMPWGTGSYLTFSGPTTQTILFHEYAMRHWFIPDIFWANHTNYPISWICHEALVHTWHFLGQPHKLSYFMNMPWGTGSYQTCSGPTTQTILFHEYAMRHWFIPDMFWANHTNYPISWICHGALVHTWHFLGQPHKLSYFMNMPWGTGSYQTCSGPTTQTILFHEYAMRHWFIPDMFWANHTNYPISWICHEALVHTWHVLGQPHKLSYFMNMPWGTGSYLTFSGPTTQTILFHEYAMRHWFIPDIFWANHTNYPISWICHEALVHTRHFLGQPHKLSYFMNMPWGTGSYQTCSGPTTQTILFHEYAMRHWFIPDMFWANHTNYPISWICHGALVHTWHFLGQPHKLSYFMNMPWGTGSYQTCSGPTTQTILFHEYAMRHWFIPDMFWANHTNYPISWICHEALVHTWHVLGQPHKLSYFMNMPWGTGSYLTCSGPTTQTILFHEYAMRHWFIPDMFWANHTNYPISWICHEALVHTWHVLGQPHKLSYFMNMPWGTGSYLTCSGPTTQTILFHEYAMRHWFIPDMFWANHTNYPISWICHGALVHTRHVLGQPHKLSYFMNMPWGTGSYQTCSGPTTQTILFHEYAMRHWFIPDMFWANHTNYPISWICHEALVHTWHVLGQPHKLSYFMNMPWGTGSYQTCSGPTT